ncbi:MAG: hypothetical protein JWO62_893 [Acidimicrobiaceae bacterium]|nr:hypothetical protein [Acidimicrobiaceae bacterium]
MASQKRPTGSRTGQGTGRASQTDKAAQGSGAGAGAPRRLGGQAPSPRNAKSAGAARRYERSRKKSSSWIGWASVAVVVVLIAVLVAVKLTSSSPKTSAASAAAAAGRNPAPAPASITSVLASIPASTFDSVGVAGLPAPFTVTTGQSSLTLAGEPQFVYVGGEFCPYCALMRWSMVTALDRFGTFTGLKEISSANTDGDIPTFSFVGSTYSSKYVSFAPYETADRLQNPFQTAPNSVNALYTKYDGSGTTPAKPFNPAASAGIPFLDIGNKYVSAGDPAAMANLFASSGVLNNGGPGRAAIAAALSDPSSAVGKAIEASIFIAEANYISAGICSLDGGKPASVCASPGVKAAAKVLSAAKPVS